uniref:Peptidylprolyl isomerase n=1 Tax=Opuntia streptacantha TaxID=393608 RepID=A0A7C9A2P5_OPUST
MASCFTPHTFLSHPLSSTPQLSPSSCSKTPPPSQTPTTPPSQPPPQPSLSATPPQQPTPKVVESSRKTNVETTDWIASSLTRRFGVGAGLAWAGFLAVGVVSEQIKTRLEVSQEQANTRYVKAHLICMIIHFYFIFLLFQRLYQLC